MITRNRQILFPAIATLLLTVALGILFLTSPSRQRFNGQQAYQDVLAQLEMGPRIAGSEAHQRVILYIQQELKKAGWQVEIQTAEWQGFPVQNILATRGEAAPLFLLGAHYDCRQRADQDAGPAGETPVPGANDGASGVAVLLELARTLPVNAPPVGLVFLDAEDDGGLEGRSWIMGSRAFVSGLTEKPRAVVIVDMVGDADLTLYIEGYSDPALAASIWSQAAALGYEQQFIPIPKYSVIDDHLPFLEAGIPAVDIIDLDYPYWHTAADTADKVSPQSLEIVGETLRRWLLSQQ